MNPARQLEQRRESTGACIRCGSPLAGVPKRKRVSGRAPSESMGRTPNSIYRRRLIMEVEGRHLEQDAMCPMRDTKDQSPLIRPPKAHSVRSVWSVMVRETN